MVLLKIARPKDREFVVKGMIAGTKDHEIRIATVVLSIPLYDLRTIIKEVMTNFATEIRCTPYPGKIARY